MLQKDPGKKALEFLKDTIISLMGIPVNDHERMTLPRGRTFAIR